MRKEKIKVNLNGVDIEVKELNNERILYLIDVMAIGLSYYSLKKCERFNSISRVSYSPNASLIIRKSDFIILIDEVKKYTPHKKSFIKGLPREEYYNLLKDEVINKYYDNNKQPLLISQIECNDNTLTANSENNHQDTQLEILSQSSQSSQPTQSDIDSVANQIIENNSKASTLDEKISLFKTLLDLVDILLDKCNADNDMKVNTYNKLLEEIDLPIVLESSNR